MGFLSDLPLWVQALFATLFTYAMTAAGAAFVFLSKNFNKKILTVMMGLAAGIMIAASFFSLLLPAKERCEASGQNPAFILTVGFLAGGAFIVLSDILLGRLSAFSEREKKSGFLMSTAMTLHNIPEGLAVGVAFGSIVGGAPAVSAVMLALGIGIQNFPEGLCVSVPLRRQGMSPGKAFFIGQASGFVEVPSGILGALAVGVVSSLLPWALAFSAGAMIAVVCSELIPSGFAENKTAASCGVIFGFSLMMFLDILLG